MLRNINPPFAIILLGLCLFLFHKERSGTKNALLRRFKTSDESFSDFDKDETEDEYDKNIKTMEKIVAQYEDYTAEVISFIVSGHDDVELIRRCDIGSMLDIRYTDTDDSLEVYAFGKPVASLLPLHESHVKELFIHNIPFSAYLGGRDRSYLDNPEFDMCSAIIFYKMDGVPPSEVKLE